MRYSFWMNFAYVIQGRLTTITSDRSLFFCSFLLLHIKVYIILEIQTMYDEDLCH